MSLADWVKGSVPTHELISLIRELPPGCALDRAQRGEAALWTVTDHLLTAQFNDHRLHRSGKRQLPPGQQLHPPEAKAPRKAVPARPKEPPGKGWDDLNALFDGG